jgi:GrpB-like predicted nucleotidyltransferase (UPF0157 family)
LHVVASQGGHWERYLKFRDVLRGNAAISLEYERLKQDASGIQGTDRSAYTAAKDSFIRSVLGRALV